MNKINNIHNKTKELETDEMPYNNRNILILEENLQNLLNTNGLTNVKIYLGDAESSPPSKRVPN